MAYRDINSSVRSEEDHIATSDGVTLRMIDFIPACDVPERPMVVFVAGWISHLDGWMEVLQRVVPRYRTLYVETREKVSAVLTRSPVRVDFSMSRMSRDLFEIVDKKVPLDKNFCLVGSSLGATVILDYLSDSRRQPERSILIAPIGELTYPFWLPLLLRPVPPSLYSAIKPFLKWYLRNVRLDKRREPEQVKKYEGTLDAADPRRLKANAFAIKDYKAWNRLPDISSPVVIIGARTDTLHGLDMIHRMADLIPRVKMEMLSSNRETHSERMGDLIVEQMEKISAP